ncbi:hypothetical protein K439DRAFT_1614641 [Ramaria rubella]|nr:hypothetical protein K439DRAFT_1614641 [Ramaria rubella]
MTLIPTLPTLSPETGGSSIDASYGCSGWEGRAEGLLHCEGQGAVRQIGLRGYVGRGKANAERMGPKARSGTESPGQRQGKAWMRPNGSVIAEFTDSFVRVAQGQYHSRTMAGAERGREWWAGG